MGCVSSKYIARSVRLHQRLRSKSMQKSIHRTHSLEEKTAISLVANRDDDFLALFCTKQAGTHEPNITPMTKNGVLSSESVTLTQELAGAEGKLIDTPKRSKSWHSFTDNGIVEEEEWNSKSIGRTRSFHTVEEYDALLANLRLFGTQQVRFHGEVEEDSPHSSSNESEHDFVDYQISEMLKSPQENRDKRTSKMVSHTSPTKKESLLISGDESIQEQEAQTLEKGCKRKCVAKCLESLDIPENSVEFKTVGSLREWLNVGGQVYSPGSYVTSRFGSYSSPMKSRHGNRTAATNDDGVFNPEMVADFENHMQQLEAEVEILLKEIVENVHGDTNPEEIDWFPTEI